VDPALQKLFPSSGQAERLGKVATLSPALLLWRTEILPKWFLDVDAPLLPSLRLQDYFIHLCKELLFLH